MSEKFRGKYRTTSIRKPGWNYNSDGAYFVTICTKNRRNFFGRISNGRMENSEMGVLARKFWDEIPNHFPFVKLGEYVIMPDHLHGIIILKNADFEKFAEAPNLGASTVKGNNGGIQKWKPGNLGVIINQFKRICTIHSRKLDPQFAWQSRYYDHIIRDEMEFHRISEYIRNNPEKYAESTGR